MENHDYIDLLNNIDLLLQRPVTFLLVLLLS